MYVAHLTMSQQSPSEKEAVSDALDVLLSALRMNGQVCGREFPIGVAATGYVATMLIPERTALDAANHNSYVRKGLEKLQGAGLAELVCEIAEDLDGAGACECACPPSYILYTYCVSLEPPLRCGGCFRPVPLYRIPPTYDEEYYDIIQWQSYYQACDTLQMNCTPMERAAIRQLSRLDSGLTKEGLEICRRIHTATQTPTYYHLHRERGRGIRQEKKRLCPSCQGEWLLPAGLHHFDFKCDRCHLLSNIARDVRGD